MPNASGSFSHEPSERMTACIHAASGTKGRPHVRVQTQSRRCCIDSDSSGWRLVQSPLVLFPKRGTSLETPKYDYVGQVRHAHRRIYHQQSVACWRLAMHLLAQTEGFSGPCSVIS